MSDRLVDLLDRQVAAAMRRQDPAEFMLALVRFVGFLRSDARLAVHVEEIRREAEVYTEAWRHHEADVIPQLVRLRDELLKLVPALDDSAMTEPTFEESSMAFERSFALFDRLAAGRPRRDNVIEGNRGGLYDSTRSGEMVSILVERAREAREASASDEATNEDVRRLELEIRSIASWQTYKYRQRIIGLRASAATALMGLEVAVREVNPRPVAPSPDVPAMAALAMNVLSRPPWAVALAKALFDPVTLKREDREALGETVARMRTHLDVLAEELRRRIGAVASRLALVERFRTRCEWHDRERLFVLADQRAGELALTAELARFLFDQGLNPVTRMRAAELEPDVFDPSVASALYVEAKRYKTGSNARKHIISGLSQVHDTAGRMRGTPYAVDEVFYVVFRQGGPRYELPAQVQGEGYVVYPMLVDIAPTAESGSRNRERPRRIDASELEPLLHDDD